MGVLLFTTWYLASTPIPPDAARQQDEIEFLSGEVEALRQKLDRAIDRQAMLEHESSIQREANRLLRLDEAARQAEINRMQSQLDFYQRLAGSGASRNGLDIYRLELLFTPSARVFQFVMTLTQNIQRAAVVSGKVGISVEGTLDDRPVTLYWSQLTDGNTAEPSFRFKYFQQLEGYFSLPEGFEPVQLSVTLDTSSRRSALQKSYDWLSLLGLESTETD